MVDLLIRNQRILGSRMGVRVVKRSKAVLVIVLAALGVIVAKGEDGGLAMPSHSPHSESCCSGSP